MMRGRDSIRDSSIMTARVPFEVEDMADKMLKYPPVWGRVVMGTASATYSWPVTQSVASSAN